MSECASLRVSHLGVLGLCVVLHSLGPLLTIGIVVTNTVPRQHHQLIVTTASLQQLNDTKPVSQPHSQLDGQVLSVDLTVQRLRLIKALEVHGYLSALLDLVVQSPETLHELDALIVDELDEGLTAPTERPEAV